MPGRHRGIQLKRYNDQHRGFRELLGEALPEPAEENSPGSAADEPSAAATGHTLARAVRQELEAALGILDQALAELAASDWERKKT